MGLRMVFSLGMKHRTLKRIPAERRTIPAPKANTFPRVSAALRSTKRSQAQTPAINAANTTECALVFASRMRRSTSSHPRVSRCRYRSAIEEQQQHAYSVIPRHHGIFVKRQGGKNKKSFKPEGERRENRNTATATNPIPTAKIGRIKGEFTIDFPAYRRKCHSIGCPSYCTELYKSAGVAAARARESGRTSSRQNSCRDSVKTTPESQTPRMTKARTAVPFRSSGFVIRRTARNRSAGSLTNPAIQLMVSNGRDGGIFYAWIIIFHDGTRFRATADFRAFLPISVLVFLFIVHVLCGGPGRVQIRRWTNSGFVGIFGPS